MEMLSIYIGIVPPILKNPVRYWLRTVATSTSASGSPRRSKRFFAAKTWAAAMASRVSELHLSGSSKTCGPTLGASFMACVRNGCWIAVDSI